MATGVPTFSLRLQPEVTEQLKGDLKCSLTRFGVGKTRWKLRQPSLIMLSNYGLYPGMPVPGCQDHLLLVKNFLRSRLNHK